MPGGVVTSGILFAINTTGGGKAKLAFAAVAAGVFLVGRKLNAARLAAEEFADTFTRLNQEQRDAVRTMERVTKGLIDTKQEMDSVVKITEAQMKATPELMSAIGRLAVDVGQKLGEGPEGITTRVKKLTDAIAKGQSRALKEYGIDLIETEDLIEAQAEAYDKVIARAKGLTTEMQTLTEQQFALNNNWETFLGLVVGRAGTIGVLGELNSVFTDLNDSLMSADDGFAEATLSAEQFGNSIAADIFEMAGFTEQAWKMNSELGRMIEAQSRLKQIQAKGKAFREQMAYIGTMGPEEAKVIQSYVAAGGDAGEAIAMSQQIEKEQLKQKTQGTKARPTGGGKAAAAAPALVGEEKWAAELALDQARKEEQIAHNEWRLANDAEYLDRMIQQEMEADAELKEMYTVEKELTQQEKWTRQLAENEATRELEIEHHEWSMLNDAYYREQYLIGEQAKNDADIAEAKRVKEAKFAFAQSTLQGIGGIFTNLSSLMRSEHKKQFELGKKAAYAATVVNTAAAAMGAYKSLASIPYVGVALGIAAAAAAVTAGGIQLATIKGQKFDTGGGGVSAGAVGSGGGGYLGGGGNYAAGGPGGAGGATHITIQIGEEEFADFFYNMNDKQSQKGNPKAFVTEEAA